MPNTYFQITGTSPAFDLKLSDSQVFRKELIYEGQFQKGDMKFSVAEKDIDNWILNFQKFKDVGIDVPLQVEHTNDPELCRGKVVGMQKGTNEAGLTCLFGYLSFRDEEAAKMADTAQVSIYSESDFQDGKGNKYQNVIRHVALTNHPVIPALEEFHSISASLTPAKDEPKMLKKLAQELGLSLSEDTDDQGSYDAILSHFNSLNLSIEDMKKAMKKKEEGDDEDDEDDKEKKKKADMAASFAKKYSKKEAASRKNQIDQLVLSGKVTKVVADGLKDTYCKEDSLALSFDDEGEIHDSFDATLKALNENDTVLSFNERTGGQKYSSDGDNPMIRAAEERAQAAKAN